MIKRSFDLPLLLKVTDTPAIRATADDFRLWFENPRNLMFTEGRNVGLATYEYPGLYSVHWFFEVRGRKAIDLGKRMVKNLFENYGAEVVRGFIRVDLKASRWAARQIGLKSFGIVTFADGEDNELFCVTKKEFLDSLEKDIKNG